MKSKLEKTMDTCPKCNKSTWNMNVYLHITAPASFYGNLSKKKLMNKKVKTQAVLWEATSWWCSNYECCYNCSGARQVRLEEAL